MNKKNTLLSGLTKNKSKEKQQQWIQLKPLKLSDKISNQYQQLYEQQSFMQNQPQRMRRNTGMRVEQNNKINNSNMRNQMMDNNRIGNSNQYNQRYPRQYNPNRVINNQYNTNQPIQQHQRPLPNNNPTKYGVSPTFRLSIPLMLVNCQKCTYSQKVPGNSRLYICCVCNQISSCYPLYGIFTCGICYINVIYPYNTSQFIRCNRCQTINKVSTQPKREYKQTEISIGVEIQQQNQTNIMKNNDDIEYQVIQKANKININQSQNIKQLKTNQQINQQFQNIEQQLKNQKQQKPSKSKQQHSLIDLQLKQQQQIKQSSKERQFNQLNQLNQNTWEVFDNKMYEKQHQNKQILYIKNNNFQQFNKFADNQIKSKQKIQQINTNKKNQYPNFFD